MSTPSKNWISFGRAAEKLGIDRHAVRRLAQGGLLTTRTIPGTRPRIWEPDVVRLADRSTRHARPE